MAYLLDYKSHDQVDRGNTNKKLKKDYYMIYLLLIDLQFS